MKSKVFTIFKIVILAQILSGSPECVLGQKILTFNDFFQTWTEWSNFTESLSFTAIQLSLLHSHSKAKECYEKQRDYYEDMISKFIVEAKAAENSFDLKLGSPYDHIRERCQFSLFKMTELMTSYPKELNSLITKQNNKEATDLIDKIMRDLQYYSREFSKQMIILRNENSEIADKAEEDFLNVRKRVTEKAQKCIQKFRKCLILKD